MRGLGLNATRVVAVSALVVGMVVVLLLLAASKDTYEVHAVFDDVRGLIPGGDVTAGASVVGSVASVELNEDGDPEVTMQVQSDFELHRGAFANIRLGSNVGAVNRVVDLEQGDPSEPELEDGATLSGRQTDQPVDFDLAVSTLTPEVRGQLKQILVGLDESLEGRGDDFDRILRYSAETLNETADLLAEINQDGEALRTIVSEGQKVVTALASSPEDLGEAADRTAALLEITGDRQAELAQSVELLGPALANGRELLDRTAAATPNLRELVAGAGPVVDALGPFSKLIPPASEAAAPFFRETRALVEEVPDQLREQRPLLRLAPPLLDKLNPAVDLLNPVADELRIYTPETIGFLQNVADAAASYDANGHLIRVASTSANTLPPSTASGGTLSPFDCGPGLLEAPFSRAPGAVECDPWLDFDESRIGGGD